MRSTESEPRLEDVEVEAVGSTDLARPCHTRLELGAPILWVLQFSDFRQSDSSDQPMYRM